MFPNLQSEGIYCTFEIRLKVLVTHGLPVISFSFAATGGRRNVLPFTAAKKRMPARATMRTINYFLESNEKRQNNDSFQRKRHLLFFFTTIVCDPRVFFFFFFFQLTLGILILP